MKVLDFGLAKAMEPAAGSSPSMSMSPTITTPAMMTGVGMILGTAAYMAPEQARGKPVDKRADIWAFGCALFEKCSRVSARSVVTTCRKCCHVCCNESQRGRRYLQDCHQRCSCSSMVWEENGRRSVAVRGTTHAHGRFSPDGRWVAYQSLGTGRNEVYVQSTGAEDVAKIVSTDGGTAPRWRADGRELFYMNGDAIFPSR